MLWWGFFHSNLWVKHTCDILWDLSNMSCQSFLDNCQLICFRNVLEKYILPYVCFFKNLSHSQYSILLLFYLLLPVILQKICNLLSREITWLRRAENDSNRVRIWRMVKNRYPRTGHPFELRRDSVVHFLLKSICFFNFHEQTPTFTGEICSKKFQSLLTSRYVFPWFVILTRFFFVLQWPVLSHT